VLYNIAMCLGGVGFIGIGVLLLHQRKDFKERPLNQVLRKIRGPFGPYMGTEAEELEGFSLWLRSWGVALIVVGIVVVLAGIFG
jgi:hypothetical protein